MKKIKQQSINKDLTKKYNQIMKGSVAINKIKVGGSFEKFSFYKDYQTIATSNATL